METHTSFRTSDRLAPLAIISSVCFSAANKDSACNRLAVCGPCLNSNPAGRTTPAASMSCIPSGLSRDSGGTHHVLHPGVPVYDPFVITYALRTAHANGMRSHSLIKLRFYTPATCPGGLLGGRVSTSRELQMLPRNSAEDCVDRACSGLHSRDCREG